MLIFREVGARRKNDSARQAEHSFDILPVHIAVHVVKHQHVIARQPTQKPHQLIGPSLPVILRRPGIQHQPHRAKQRIKKARSVLKPSDAGVLAPMQLQVFSDEFRFSNAADTGDYADFIMRRKPLLKVAESAVTAKQLHGGRNARQHQAWFIGSVLHPFAQFFYGFIMRVNPAREPIHLSTKVTVDAQNQV